jgi:hypothetical protein
MGEVAMAQALAGSDKKSPVVVVSALGEQWKVIPGFPGYLVSDLGRVWSRWARGGPRFIGSQQSDGRMSVRLYPYPPNGVADRPQWFKVHALVLELFQGPRAPGMVARHLDGNHLNNAASNLAWGTRAENNTDSVRHGIATSHRITPELRGAIRADREGGLTYLQLITKYRLAVVTIWRVLKVATP